MTVRRSLWVPEAGFSPENGSVTLQPEDRLPAADRGDIGNSQIVPLRGGHGSPLAELSAVVRVRDTATCTSALPVHVSTTAGDIACKEQVKNGYPGDCA